MQGDGVIWSPRAKATCPQCGLGGVTPYTTRPWEGGARLRYHKCPACGANFKSVEQDATTVPELVRSIA